MSGHITIHPETVHNPITVIGRNAGICYGSDTSDPAKNYLRGLDCIKHRHFRALEYATISIIIEGYSAKVMREYYTHIGGMPTRLQASTRYIEYGDFDYIIPHTVKNNASALSIYEQTMHTIRENIKVLEQACHIPKEDSSMLLPFGMTTKVVCRTNARNLMDMSRNRECSTAFWEFREVFADIKRAASMYDTEWKTLIDMLFYPKCVELKYCPEGKSCGRYPTLEQIRTEELSQLASE